MIIMHFILYTHTHSSLHLENDSVSVFSYPSTGAHAQDGGSDGLD